MILTPRLVESGPEVELFLVADDTYDVVCRGCWFHAPMGYGVTESQGYALFAELFAVGWPHNCEDNRAESAADRARDNQEALELESGWDAA